MTPDYEVGFANPGGVQARADALSEAYNLLWDRANRDQRARIRPRKLAWESYAKRLHDSWLSAFFETGEIAAYEGEFARLREEIERQGADLSDVPAIAPPASRLQPIADVARAGARIWTVTAATAGVVGTVLLIRSWTKGSRR